MLARLVALPIHAQITVLLATLAAVDRFGYFLEDVSAEDIPDPIQSAAGLLIALAFALVAFISATADSDD